MRAEHHGNANLTACDQQQSVLASAGAARSYPPYGALPAAIGPRLAYCGQAREAATGFYHLGNGYRSYDPCLMRFLSADALSPFAKGGINAYTYCAGDPINYQDRNDRASLRNTSPAIGATGRNLTGNMFQSAPGPVSTSPGPTSTQAYGISTSPSPAGVLGVDENILAVGSAAAALGHAAVGFKQLGSNNKAALANFGAAAVHVVGAGVAAVESRAGYWNDIPGQENPQFGYLGFGVFSGFVKGAQVFSSVYAAYLSVPGSNTSANGGPPGISIELQMLNPGGDSSSAVGGNSRAGAQVRGSS
ncbi:RHS repeat-associated core domain-containing protein [Pseudomonas mosselii]|uniref:RHS repeat-associated core domain-containing protein n=1 Tax=Pseudomonas mosselii TaxID=78327 RepID=UPI0009BCC01E